MNELLGSDYYDEEYFEGNTKSKYGGYDATKYATLKNHQAIQILKYTEYTSRWKPDNVLIIGCAKGLLVRGMMAIGVYAEGIDISEYAIEESKKYTTNCYVGNACDMSKYNDEHFEISVAMNVLENIPEPYLKEALDEMCRVTLRYIVITTPIGDDDEEHDKSKDENYWQTHFSVHTPGWWEKEFLNRGFVKRVEKSVENNNVFMILERI